MSDIYTIWSNLRATHIYTKNTILNMLQAGYNFRAVEIYIFVYFIIY